MQFPNFIERNPAVIQAEMKEQLEGLLGRELQPAQVEQLLLQFVAYQEILLLNRFNAGLASSLLSFATAPIIDYIGELVAVERLPASFAGTTVRFTLVGGHGSVVIPEGTRVSSSDGKAIFATSDDVFAQPSVTEVDVHCLAMEAGTQSNGYEIGAINTILDPLAFVSTVSNIGVTGGGADVENDDSFRERIRLSPNQYTTAGSRGSYIFHAKSASPAIIDVSVFSPIPGTVFIVPLIDESTADYAQVIAEVYRTCSAETVRPLTDNVVVAQPTPIEYEIKVNLTIYGNANSTEVQNAATQRLREFASEAEKRLGQDIVISRISCIARAEGVFDVEVVNPTSNMSVSENEYAKCTSITVNIIGSI